jgi:glyoxylase-like metal-dependent hydrolase (beta-lactamase superfamily II)
MSSLKTLAAFSLAACLLPLAALRAQSPHDIVRRAVTAIGGEQAVRGVSNTTVEFNAASFGLGQEETPESPPRATLASGRIVADWGNHRRVFTQELRPVAGGVVRQRRVMAGGIGVFDNNGALTPETPLALAGIERGMRFAPERLLLLALDNPSALTVLRPRQWRGETMDGVRYANGPDTASLYFDRMSGLLTVAESVVDDPILGDRRNVAWFTRWQEIPSAGIKIPRQIDSEANGRLLSHTVITSASANSTLDSTLFAIPDSIVAKAQKSSTAIPPVVVTLVELAPGVWRAEGGSHHSLVVEQPRQLVVVEAPQTSVRSRAVLDTLRARFKGKSVGVVVNTHHHWDHAGGLRAYMAAGVPVLTHRRNADFVRRIASARKTIDLDALSRRPRVPIVQVVSDSVTIGSDDSRVVVYRIPTAHVEGMLGAYVPAAKLLFVSDVLSPAAALAPAGSAEVVAAVRARGVTVDRVAGGHGGVAVWGDVERAGAR